MQGARNDGQMFISTPERPACSPQKLQDAPQSPHENNKRTYTLTRLTDSERHSRPKLSLLGNECANESTCCLPYGFRAILSFASLPNLHPSAAVGYWRSFRVSSPRAREPLAITVNSRSRSDHCRRHHAVIYDVEFVFPSLLVVVAAAAISSGWWWVRPSYFEVA